VRFAYFLGVLVQALVLGILLFFAIGRLIGMSAGARIFQYQAF
jgi:hypothetical protein